jgi:replicative DNA helicase
MSTLIADVLSEQIAAAGLLHSTRLADEVLVSCTADSFTDPNYRALYEAAGRLRSQSLPISSRCCIASCAGAGRRWGWRA